MEKYSYVKIANLDRLTIEIRNSDISIALDHIELVDDALDIWFKGELSENEMDILLALVIAHVDAPIAQPPVDVNIANSKKDSKGITKVSIYEPEGFSATVATHDFTDKCSWFGDSVLVQNEVAVQLEDEKKFQLAHTFIIDMAHGRCYDEDVILLATPSYKPVVKLDDVVKVEGVDFEIDYALGQIIFPEIVEGELKVSYHYATTSNYILKPRPNMILQIKTAEIQFSKDVSITNPIIFEVYAEVASGVKVAVPGTRIAYKNEKDFMNACNGGQGFIPQWGNIDWETIVFPFDYARPKALKSSQKVEIRVFLRDHTPLPGKYATGTFYITSEPEV